MQTAGENSAITFHQIYSTPVILYRKGQCSIGNSYGPLLFTITGIGKWFLNEVLYRVPSLLAPLHVIRDKTSKLQSYPSCTDTSLGKSTLGTESRSGRFRAYANDFSLVK